MHLEIFSEGSSFFHRLDPRVKILLAASFTTVVAVTSSFEIAAVSLVLSLLLLSACRLRLKPLLSRFAVLNGFFLFLFIVLPFSVPGKEIFALGPLTATYEGVKFAALVAVKGNAIYGAVIGLLSTSSVIVLGHALHHLKVPGKLVQLFFFTFRYISVLHDEYERIQRALKMRCFVPRTSLHTYKTFAYVVGVLFLSSFERAVRIYQAMVLRGFDGTFRTLNHFTMERKDVVAGVFGFSVIGLLLMAQVVMK